MHVSSISHWTVPILLFEQLSSFSPILLFATGSDNKLYKERQKVIKITSMESLKFQNLKVFMVVPTSFSKTLNLFFNWGITALQNFLVSAKHQLLTQCLLHARHSVYVNSLPPFSSFYFIIVIYKHLFFFITSFYDSQEWNLCFLQCPL